MQRAHKIALLTSVHPPFDTRIFYKEAKALVNAGYDVVLIVPHEADQTVDGVRIRAVPKSTKRSMRMTQTVYRVLQAALDENSDVYHFHDPELLFVGLLLKLRGKNVIYDVHEDLPLQVMNKHWIPGELRKAVSLASNLTETVSARAFDGIVAATPIIAQRFPEQRTVVVQNFPIHSDFATVHPIPHKERAPITVYLGSMTLVRGIREIVRALDFIPEDRELELSLAGNFSPAELESEIRQMSGWQRVNFLGWQSKGKVIELLSHARIGLVTLHPTPSYVESYPIKLFEYMSAGIPVIASDFALWREIIEEASCGILIDPLDPKSIAEAMTWLLDHPAEAEAMGKRGQEAIENRFNWEFEKDKLLVLYRRIFDDYQATAYGQLQPEHDFINPRRSRQ